MSGLTNVNTGGGGPGPPGPPSPYNTIVRPYIAGVAINDAVYQTGGGSVAPASATSTATTPVLGLVLMLDNPTPGNCLVQIDGDIAGMSGLSAGEIFILSTIPGKILWESATGSPGYPTAHGNVIQQVGIAMSPSTLLIDIQDQEEV